MRLIFIIAVVFLAGCSRVTLDDYRDTTPVLDLKTFFDGPLMAYGILQDRSGKVTRRFKATIDASWNGEQGTLVEHFIYDDGEEQDRIWQLSHLGNGRYTGVAGDVVGSASGEISGAAFNWKYNLEVPYNDGTIVVNLDDWLFLINEDHLMNRTVLRKFGFRVGELSLVIEKVN
ncbi:MAG: DUF3833 domain-containing protein [Gammaproteobacteria bacterium]|nr:DUF3833 domain-containing protein [Gammaproteobacteria bacterium]